MSKKIVAGVMALVMVFGVVGTLGGVNKDLFTVSASAEEQSAETKTIKEMYSSGELLDQLRRYPGLESKKDEDFIVEDGIYYVLDEMNIDDKIEKIAYVVCIDDDKKEAVLPKEVHGYRVYGLRHHYILFNEKYELEKLDVSNCDVTDIMGEWCMGAPLGFKKLSFLSTSANIIHWAYLSQIETLKTVQFNQEIIKAHTSAYGQFSSSLPYAEKIIISDNVKTIEPYVFLNMNTVKGYVIGKNVKDIGEYSIGYSGKIADKAFEKMDGFKIYCYKDTAGEKYAIDNGFDYVLLDGVQQKGDANGDNDINVSDISVTAAHIKGIKPLTDEQMNAADVNSDNELTVTDISMIASHIKGIKPLA